MFINFLLNGKISHLKRTKLKLEAIKIKFFLSEEKSANDGLIPF